MALHRGRVAKRPTILEARPLTRDDLACLREARPPQGMVRRFRETHHRVARLIASGLRRQDVMERSGYSAQRIYLLEADPAFQELIATYRERASEAFVEAVDEYYSVATNNMLRAESMIADKLDEAEASGDHLPTRDLIAISRDAADRFGYGKKQLNLNINANLGSALERAIARSGKGTTLDAKVIPDRPALASRPTEVAATRPTHEEASVGFSFKSRALGLDRRRA